MLSFLNITGNIYYLKREQLEIIIGFNIGIIELIIQFSESKFFQFSNQKQFKKSFFN